MMRQKDIALKEKNQKKKTQLPEIMVKTGQVQVLGRVVVTSDKSLFCIKQPLCHAKVVNKLRS
jgi:hypothetical protein